MFALDYGEEHQYIQSLIKDKRKTHVERGERLMFIPNKFH